MKTFTGKTITIHYNSDLSGQTDIVGNHNSLYGIDAQDLLAVEGLTDLEIYQCILDICGVNYTVIVKDTKTEFIQGVYFSFSGVPYKDMFTQYRYRPLVRL